MVSIVPLVKLLEIRNDESLSYQTLRACFKPYKLFLILSIHENERYVLENSKPVKLTLKLLNLYVCGLEHINTIYLYTKSKHK